MATLRPRKAQLSGKYFTDFARWHGPVEEVALDLVAAGGLVTAASCSLVSMPSATLRISSFLARLATASIMATQSARSGRSRTKLRSILMVSNGKLRR